MVGVDLVDDALVLHGDVHILPHTHVLPRPLRTILMELYSLRNQVKARDARPQTQTCEQLKHMKKPAQAGRLTVEGLVLR
jgi:hypothetical protein